MNLNAKSTGNAMLFTVLGAAVGAAVVALTTPKTGREVRDSLKTAARRLRQGKEEADEVDNGTIDALFI